MQPVQELRSYIERVAGVGSPLERRQTLRLLGRELVDLRGRVDRYAADAEKELDAGAAVQEAFWDGKLHPRDRSGKWSKKLTSDLKGLEAGQSMHVGNDIHVTRVGGKLHKQYDVHDNSTDRGRRRIHGTDDAVIEVQERHRRAEALAARHGGEGTGTAAERAQGAVDDLEGVKVTSGDEALKYEPGLGPEGSTAVLSAEDKAGMHVTGVHKAHKVAHKREKFEQRVGAAEDALTDNVEELGHHLTQQIAGGGHDQAAAGAGAAGHVTQDPTGFAVNATDAAVKAAETAAGAAGAGATDAGEFVAHHAEDLAQLLSHIRPGSGMAASVASSLTPEDAHFVAELGQKLLHLFTALEDPTRYFGERLEEATDPMERLVMAAFYSTAERWRSGG